MQIDDEYKLYLDYTIRMIDRRGSITTTYLTVNAGVLGALAFVFKDLQVGENWRLISGLVLLFAGIVTCFLWRKLVRQYAALLKWWYEQLRELEEKMSPGSKVLQHEYEALYQRKNHHPDMSLADDEEKLAVLFTFLYGLSFVGVLAALISHLV